jgi:transposase
MSNTEKAVKDIRRNTRRKFSSEEKIRIVLDGLWGECSIVKLWSACWNCLLRSFIVGM